MTFDVGERVRIITGSHAGEVGRIVVRKPIEAFGHFDFVYEVDFEFSSRGRGYTVQFQGKHLERSEP
jgi:hypothetical protein